MVVAREPALRFVLYSEDRDERALETLEHLLRGMLKLIVPAAKTNHLAFEPVLPTDTKIHGNHWKTRDSVRDAQRLRRKLIAAVATELLRGRVVFFHIDADAVWADVKREQCENKREHWPRFCRDVLTTCSHGKGTNVFASVEMLEQVLILAMPAYEVESWAFANTTRLRELLRDERDLAALAGWENDLGGLDECEHTKELLSIGDAHNAELVQTRCGFPAEELARVPKSYAATVARLRGSPSVMRGLAEAAERPF